MLLHRQRLPRERRAVHLQVVRGQQATVRGHQLTGRKLDQKKYHWHTGWPGGIKDRTARKVMEGRFPARIVEKAVERMLPRGPLGRQQLKNLRVYAGSEHPHEAQQPETLDIAALSSKNARIS